MFKSQGNYDFLSRLWHSWRIFVCFSILQFSNLFFEFKYSLSYIDKIMVNHTIFRCFRAKLNFFSQIHKQTTEYFLAICLAIWQFIFAEYSRDAFNWLAAERGKGIPKSPIGTNSFIHELIKFCFWNCSIRGKLFMSKRSC